MGTFWPYSADPEAKLTAVSAGTRRVTVERTALTIEELVRANVGASVIITGQKSEGDIERIENWVKEHR